MKAITVAVPGSCGELVQGVYNGQRFHISCPIDTFNLAHFSRDSAVPGERPRAHKSIAALRAALGRRAGGSRVWDSVGQESRLEPGLGMASSTADIGAIAAVGRLVAGEGIDEADLARLAVGIEPTDGTIFRGIVAFDHREGRFVERFGPPPALAVSYVNTGGSVDTLEFNRKKIRYSRSQGRVLSRAFEMAAAGIRRGDAYLIGRASTISAVVNQELLPKPRFDDFLEISRSRGSYGLVVAHSGTVVGVLHTDNAAGPVAAALAALGFSRPQTSRVVGGGCRAWVR